MEKSDPCRSDSCSFNNFPNDFSPELSVKFAGEIDDSLHFYTERSNDSDEVETKVCLHTVYWRNISLNEIKTRK